MSDLLISQDDFARLTGRSRAEVEAALRHLPLAPLPYRELSEREAADVAERVERTIREENLRRSGEDDPTVWIRGWGEIAASLKQTGISREALRPQYFHDEPLCRLFGRYIRPLDRMFEYNLGLALRSIIFDEFLSDSPMIAEFGAGTGINILLLSELFPKASLVAADWAPVCVDIYTQMARETGKTIRGEVFNMLTASGWTPTERDCTFLTVHAMEQLETCWYPFYDFMVQHRPPLCLHVEPLFEHYDEQSTFDDRARRYHLKRGYLHGYLPHVLAECRAGKGELIASRRVPFGGLYHEAYSILAWRPRA
jgi:hypothetical protein